ncbi:flagellar hook-length control protein FliK [Accumulibacter sp.]|jgi:hypothetical protein|uniref:Flagellar hook-length control protein-like C-terminal domain-containing protein n=1 Tax=Accumulibacter regalis TaxID=522306 RepID=C7RSG8_ACCRE|nr:flagellar hook-length control protein FliK [Accumulibacter sp.]MBN8496900.1 flagellar hook-length control protein FliK [Accumulibacter sp.]MBO3714659.1 flagellar hook-length control protein FliK [Accumulibacter sp.]
MIRADVTNRLQPAADPALRPALPTQEITDKLSGLVAGQRLLAEIESLMPNGTYRALINQRVVTLALPFAAKSGDAIELEVAESDGKLTLAVVPRGVADGNKSNDEAAATSLSRTGQLISNLLAGARDLKGGTMALPLNSNQPLAAGPPTSGRDLLPLLEQAITQSGMFYESHQADWIEGRYSKAQLLQEPQGKLPPQVPAGQLGLASADTPESMASPGANSAQTASRPLEAKGAASPLGQPSPAAQSAQSAQPSEALPTPRTPELSPAAHGSQAPQGPQPSQSTPSSQASQASETPQSTQPTQSSSPSQPAQPIAQQAQVLVQQQLEAFATQNFSWQGQVWPGQEIEWQIEDPGRRRERAGDDGAEQWQTRLRLTLPSLGEVEARLHIQGKQITLALIASNADTRGLLRGAAVDLRGQLEQAGLDLSSIGIAAPAAAPMDAAQSD